MTSNESSPYENPRGNIFTDWHQRRTALSSAAFLQDHLKPGMTLLDCGCGTGSISLGLAEVVAPGMVVGIDLDRERIERARTQALAPNLRFDVGDVYSLPFEEGSFDVVFASSVLEHLAEPNSALAEMARVLVPDGIVAVSDTDHDGQFWARVNADLVAFQQFFEDWNRERGTNFFIGKDLKGLLNQAGFVQLQVSASCRVYADPEELEQWAQLGAQALGNADAIRFANQAGIQANSLVAVRVSSSRMEVRPGCARSSNEMRGHWKKAGEYVEDESLQTRT